MLLYEGSRLERAMVAVADGLIDMMVDDWYLGEDAVLDDVQVEQVHLMVDGIWNVILDRVPWGRSPWEGDYCMVCANTGVTHWSSHDLPQVCTDCGGASASHRD